MPTDTDRGIRRLDNPCWTIQLADGRPAGFEESEPHFLTKEEADKDAAGYQPEGEPPVKVIQLDTHCWVANLLCGELFIDEGGDFPAMHFTDEVELLTSIGEAGLFAVEPGVFACDDTDCKTCMVYATPRLHQLVASKMTEMGELALQFARVDRRTFHPDGKRPETDSDHTVMLTWIACALASEYHPELNVGLVAQFCAVHDLPEVHAGDTPTLRLPDEQSQKIKKSRERSALHRVRFQFNSTLPWLANTAFWYEQQATREAVFVKTVDKLMPKLTHILNGGASVRAADMTADELAERYRVQRAQLVKQTDGQFPMVMALFDILVARELTAVTEADR